MWEYGEPIHPHNRQRLNCELCGKEIYGGISCLKYNLIKIVEHEAKVCSTVTLDVMHIANKSVLQITRNRDENEELQPYQNCRA